ncbi:hypothetical protein FXO38_07794 [Capsicum annuum]|nr:hypothetical protein FXO38_07794 [Capsicum annuum]KAF3671171.1 hypothetical protein FXO37_08156 [Capsicum annuum]
MAGRSSNGRPTGVNLVENVREGQFGENEREGYVPIDIRWFPPTSGVFKLNIDGSFTVNADRCGFGGVISDASETDSVEVIQLIHHPVPLYNDIIHKCRLIMLKSVESLVVQHNFQKANAVTGFLSRKGSQQLQSSANHILTSPPVELVEQLQKNISGTLYRRLLSWSMYNNLLCIGNKSVSASARTSVLVSSNAKHITTTVTSSSLSSTSVRTSPGSSSTICTNV